MSDDTPSLADDGIERNLLVELSGLILAWRFHSDDRGAACGTLEAAAVAVRERDALAVRVEQLRAAIGDRHTPESQEAEVWWGDADHDERFPDCPSGDDCEGHVCTITVCSECGYTHDGETPIFRQWPCPTVAALEAVPVPERPERCPTCTSTQPAAPHTGRWWRRDDGELLNQHGRCPDDWHTPPSAPERPERCPRCGSDDRGDRYGNEDGTRCPDSFHTPPSAPEEPNDAG